MKPQSHINTRTRKPFVSIVIPLYVSNERFFLDLQHFSFQTYKYFEVLIVTDKTIRVPHIPGVAVQIIKTNKQSTGPATKRDIALLYAEGEIIGFIDDDAYPDSHWIEEAIRSFTDEHIVAVGGPGVTPQEDPWQAQLTGLVYESRLCSGAAQYRFIAESPRNTDDYPAYNLFVRASVLREVGGYGNDFYGGEDTFLCMKLKKKGTIRYSPHVRVYHHRRNLFMPLLRQIANVGLHRGYFAKRFPETSRRWFYFMPSLLFLWLLTTSVYGVFSSFVRLVFILSVAGMVFLGAISIGRRTSIGNAFLVGVGILCVHMTYGAAFLKGLFTGKLVR